MTSRSSRAAPDTAPDDVAPTPAEAAVSAEPGPDGWRDRRLAVHLAALREPLRDIELDSRDHALLADFADQDADSVGVLVSLLSRARASAPRQAGGLGPGEMPDQLFAQAFAGQEPDPVDISQSLVQLGERVVDLLDVTAAAVVLPDQHGGECLTAGSSDGARAVARFAAHADESPCLDCVHDGAPVSGTDLADDVVRWPAFADVLSGAGFGAACAVPMRVGDEVVGALVLLHADARPVSHTCVRLGQALAEATTARIQHQRAVDGRDTERPQERLDHRVAIEEATGVLAEVSGMTPTTALVVLCDYARANNQQLADLARSIVYRTIDPSDMLAHAPAVGRVDQV